ncbi:hypothetical protein AGLY_014901 [Aphis glycines]|uniref:Uncharacterized protein n=1 Tax=Aphis glycines TaxID=307491 RepID=A0A6G0T4L4_APHGL|nr:hypothetical protein AGLY_014901 [Aphis glycines]
MYPTNVCNIDKLLVHVLSLNRFRLFDEFIRRVHHTSQLLYKIINDSQSVTDLEKDPKALLFTSVITHDMFPYLLVIHRLMSQLYARAHKNMRTTIVEPACRHCRTFVIRFVKNDSDRNTIKAANVLIIHSLGDDHIVALSCYHVVSRSDELTVFKRKLAFEDVLFTDCNSSRT